MPTIVTEGDRLLTLSGKPSWMKKPSVPFSSYAGGAVSLLGDGKTVSYTSIYRKQPWAAIVINKLGRQIARLPLKVFKIDSQGDRERVREHPLVDLLERPWKRGSANDLKQAFGFPTLLHGNSVVGKTRDRRGGPPTGFFPIDWRYATPRFAERANNIDFWELQQTGTSKFLAPEEVVHTSWWAPDGPVGVSPLQQLGITISIEDAAQRYQQASFKNAVRTPGALVAPPDVKIRPEEKEEMLKEIEQSHGGVDNAFRFLLLTGGMDFKETAQTAVEAELIEQRKLTREEMAAVYDIPPPLIGILDHATYSNVSEMHRMLYMTVLGPWLNLIEETLQSQLIDNEPAFEGLYVEFDLGEVLKGDTRQRILALKDGIGTGLYTINEARKIENLPRISSDWADTPLIPANNLSLPEDAFGEDEEEPESPPPGEEPEDEGGEADEEPDDPAPMLARHIARARASVLSRAGAGDSTPFDGERFKRELSEDLERAVSEGRLLIHAARKALDAADGLAQTISEGVQMHAGDLEAIKKFFATLGA